MRRSLLARLARTYIVAVTIGVGALVGFDIALAVDLNRNGDFCAYTKTPGVGNWDNDGEPCWVRFDALLIRFGSEWVVLMVVGASPAYLYFMARHLWR